MLAGKVTVVSVFSGQWAEGQAASFVSAEANPELQAALREHADKAQHVRVNIEEDKLKGFLIRLFTGSIRRAVPEADWGRYFVVRQGLSDEVKEAIGMLNGKVGYVYLVDSECRLRWAGSGYAEGHERVGLVTGLLRLLDEDKAVKKAKLPGSPAAARQ